MKKLIKLFVLVAAAAMALASCQKNEIPAPEKQEVHFTINAGIAETKTTITDNGNKTYTPKWESGDKIGVLFSLEDSAEAVEFENAAEAGEKARFEGKHAFTVEGASEVDGNLYAFYPSSAFNKMYDDGGVRLDLEATQYPTSTSFDPACDLLIAKPWYYMAEATGEEVEVVINDMYFARMMSVLRINLNSEFLSNETVKSVSFDADGVDLTGAMKFNLETGEFVGNQSTNQDYSEVKAIYSEEDPIAVAGEKNSAYLVVAPVTIKSGTTLTFTVETENYDIVKTISAPADMVMPAGNVAVINLTIAEENCTAKVEDTSDYSGTYAIVAENSSKFYYLTNVDNGASTKRLNSDAEMTSLPESGVKLDASLVWNVVKNDDGTYLIQSADNDLYLDHTSGNSSVLVENVEDAVALTIEETEGKYAISYVDSNSDTRNFVKNSSNPYFAFYTSKQCGPVYFVPAEISLTPAIIIAEEDKVQNVNADVTELSFAYDLKNISGVPTVTVIDGATMTGISATAEDGVVTVKFDANEDETTKTATITLSYEGATSVNVVINQAAEAAAGAAYYEKVTSEPADWSGTYLIVFDDNKAHATVSGKNFDATTAELTISDGKINASDDVNKGAVVISKNGTGYNILLPSGQYLKVSSSSTISSVNPVANYIDFVSSSTQNGCIRISGDSNFNTSSYILYHQSSYFRCYTNKLATKNYYLPDLYRLVGGGEDPETPVDPVQLTMSDITCSAQTENSLTFKWDAVTGAANYEVTFNNGTAEEVTTTSYTATGLNASTSYTISVKAVGDGTNYTTSEAKTQTGTTTAASSGGDDDDDTTGGTHYVKVTSTPADWSGTYLIVYENSSNAYVYSGVDVAKNYVSATISDNAIARSTDIDAVAVTIAQCGTGYSIKITNGTNSGKYISGGTKNGTTFETTAVANTITLNSDGTVKINNNSSTSLQFNSDSNQMRFRYFASSQKAVCLYKLN